MKSSKFTFVPVILFLFLFSGLGAQTFDMTFLAHVDDGYTAYGVTVSSNGTVFLANGGGGLRSYAFDGSSLTSTAWVDDPGTAYSVALGSSNTVYLAHGIYLLAYSFNDTSFTQLDYDMGPGSEHGVAVGPDGTVFLACLDEGLRAYSFNGSTFINTASIDNGGRALRVAVDSSGTIFLANEDDGLRVYSYDGSSFTNTAHVDSGGRAYDVAIANDGLVFLANGDDYLRAFSYDGVSLTHIAHFYSLSNTAQGLCVRNDNTVFIAHETSSARGGLWAVKYDSGTFTWASGAPITISGYGKDVAIGPDGTVFLAASGSGLYAFSCSDPVALDDIDVPGSHILKQNFPNPFNPTTILQYKLAHVSNANMIIYDISGHIIKQWSFQKQEAGLYNIAWDGTNQYDKSVSSGIYIYRLLAEDYSDSKKMLLMK